jgi:hypothetical protein
MTMMHLEILFQNLIAQISYIPALRSNAEIQLLGICLHPEQLLSKRHDCQEAYKD